VKESRRELSAAARKAQDTSWKRQSRDEIIYNDSNSKKPRETKKSRRLC
jgi:hypothetical protein